MDTSFLKSSFKVIKPTFNRYNTTFVNARSRQPLVKEALQILHHQFVDGSF